jgi:hypothetical protein
MLPQSFVGRFAIEPKQLFGLFLTAMALNTITNKTNKYNGEKRHESSGRA